jgi:hypothetical protein
VVIHAPQERAHGLAGAPAIDHAGNPGRSCENGHGDTSCPREMRFALTEIKRIEIMSAI